MHECARVRMHECARVRMHECARVRMHEFARMRMLECARVHTHECVCTCMHKEISAQVCSRAVLGATSVCRGCCPACGQPITCPLHSCRQAVPFQHATMLAIASWLASQPAFMFAVRTADLDGHACCSILLLVAAFSAFEANIEDASVLEL